MVCLSKAVRLVNEHWECMKRKERRQMPVNDYERSQSWLKPDGDAIKINLDGAFCVKNKCVGIGIVGRDKVGRFLGGFLHLWQNAWL